MAWRLPFDLSRLFGSGRWSGVTSDQILQPWDAEALAEVRSAFADCPRGGLIGNPNHCDECAEADAYLRKIDVSDVQLADVHEGVGGEAFSMIVADGFRHFIPGLCRIALMEGGAGCSFVLHRLGSRLSAVREPHHRMALAAFLEHLAWHGHLEEPGERRVCLALLERLRSPC